MSDEFIKNINLQKVTDKETEIYRRSIKNLAKPLKLLDETTSFMVTTLRIALEMYKMSDKKLEKEFLTIYLSITNAALHIIRSSRLDLVYGYYGSVMILNRALQNYLYTLMYIHHEPQDCEILLKEERDTYKKDKSYRTKFHETSLRNYLKKKGYDIPEDALDIFSKFSHGSAFSSQIFGYKGIREERNGEFDVLYAPEYDVVKAIHLIQLLMVSPLDFSRFFIMHFKKNTKKWNKLKLKLERLDKDVDRTIEAMDRQYQFFKNAPSELVEKFLKASNKK